MNYIADKIKGKIDFQIAKYFYFCSTFGEMAEWSNALVLKTSVQQCTGGSNPSLSAKGKAQQCVGLLFLVVIATGFEPVTVCLEGRCSIQLSYATIFYANLTKETCIFLILN